MIQKGQQGKINVHLGFLQVKHRYRVELNIPAEILADFIDTSHKLQLKDDDASVPNVHCKLLAFKGDTTEKLQFYELEIEFFAHKEKLLKEELKLVTSDEKSVKLVFSARVLGRVGSNATIPRRNYELTFHFFRLKRLGKGHPDAQKWSSSTRHRGRRRVG